MIDGTTPPDERSTAGDATENDAAAGAEPVEDGTPDVSRSDLAPADGSVGADGFDLDRRDWMRALSSLALFGGTGASAISTASAETADTSLTADERIQAHRTGDLEINVENPDGTAVENAAVSVTQQSHDFGTAVHAEFLTRGREWGDDVTEWEVANEVIHEPAIIEAVESDATTHEMRVTVS